MTWFDVMPSIPLAMGVPVVSIDGQIDGTALRSSIPEDPEWDVYGEEWWWIQECPRVLSRRVHEKELRVYLCSLQGFGYVLQWYLQQASTRGPTETFWDLERFDPEHSIDRWANGRITQADCVALAWGCSELKRDIAEEEA
jgi:hypothetical protein